MAITTYGPADWAAILVCGAIVVGLVGWAAIKAIGWLADKLMGAVDWITRHEK